MLATEKQLKCIKVIYNKINFCDDCLPIKNQRKERDKCLKDYFSIYKKIESNTLTESEASAFISNWIDFSLTIHVKKSGYGIRYNDGWDSDNHDIFPTDMYY